MQANPFAILISNSDREPTASHIPISVHAAEDQLVLRGHVAKANPHWRWLEQQPQCLTIFHGPHAYGSPTLYSTPENVPTRYYGCAHVYGTARVFSAPDAVDGVLDELIAIF